MACLACFKLGAQNHGAQSRALDINILQGESRRVSTTGMHRASRHYRHSSQRPLAHRLREHSVPSHPRLTTDLSPSRSLWMTSTTTSAPELLMSWFPGVSREISSSPLPGEQVGGTVQPAAPQLPSGTHTVNPSDLFSSKQPEWVSGTSWTE